MEKNHLTTIILEVINKQKPQSVKELVKMLKENVDLPEDDILESVLKLQAQGIIMLENQTKQSMSVRTYLRTGEVIWYWMTIITGVITMILTFTISESIYPWIYARNILGVIFVLFLPGYSLTKVLTQRKLHSKILNGQLEGIEIVALSIGVSIALVSIIGLVLYYSPWGLDLIIIVPVLFGFTSIISTVAFFMEYQAKSNKH